MMAEKIEITTLIDLIDSSTTLVELIKMQESVEYTVQDGKYNEFELSVLKDSIKRKRNEL